jgi:SAM-dependent methyltransferase
LQAAGHEPEIHDGVVNCGTGHEFEVKRGVLNLLIEPGQQIQDQLSENARERRGDLTEAEKAAYQRNISRIGSDTYNQLIRDNASAALDEVSIRSGRSLDLGGGSGWLAGELAQRGFDAVSLDIEDPWDRAAQIAQGRASRDYELVTDAATESEVAGVNFVVADMERLPFASAAFDLVTTSAALHHSQDPVRTLQEAARVIRPGGVLLALNEPVKGLFRDTSPILGGRAGAAGEHMYSAGAYVGFFRAAGLKPRLLFPGWVDRRLLERNWEGVVYYRRLRPLVAAFWRAPGIRSLARGPLLRPGMDLFGLTLIAAATKTS